MIKTAILVIAIMTNEGNLEMRAQEMAECPDSQAFSQVMDKFKADGKLIDWNAICIHSGGKDAKN